MYHSKRCRTGGSNSSLRMCGSPQGSGVPAVCVRFSPWGDSLWGILYTGEAPEWGSRRSSFIPGFIFSDCAEPLLGGLSHMTVATPILLKF